ncbi:PHB depolymerase family esterase [Xylophilus sp. GOD-11R]|uniref:extracellular catalytic domain type 1 short-chain-length polyhydroxyalkanoate depolymerase n=1 Tax=Xylophilus sp. GOD-11R TaxID=3089814 RepID=UPI00298CE08C|nr:PHB depolymerase family esterase [Xylophilus sp. GOD-11R]WPB56086.1 PHB depolymerase family esterase [Xylophilus sp. GOD-11R]
MDFDLQKLMTQATRLTQGGRLQEAAALLRSAMGTAPKTAPTPQAPFASQDVIDVPARRVDQPTPQPGGFTAHHFSNGVDGRDYKLFLPTGAGAAPMPLVVMLHGCTQNPDDFAAGTRMNELAQGQGFAVLYPAQSRKANPQGCWNWFKHTHQTRERGEPALIAGMVRQVMASHAIDPKRVYVAGLSAGGAMAAILGETHAELFAAVGVHSGLAAGAARDLPSAMAAMKDGARPTQRSAGSGRPTIVFHGDADATVNLRNAHAVVAAAVGPSAQAKGESSSVPGARPASRDVFRRPDGRVQAELWVVQGGPHAWSGGGAGSYTDPSGPDASQEMLRFFREHPAD